MSAVVDQLAYDKNVAAHKAKLAEMFNAVYTHSGAYERGAWMCPTCNSIHLSDDFCPFGGRLFPACCEFERGSRNDDEHRAKPRNFDPSLLELIAVAVSRKRAPYKRSREPNFFVGAKPRNGGSK